MTLTGTLLLAACALPSAHGPTAPGPFVHSIAEVNDPMSHGEIGHCGVAVDSVDDMNALFAGIPLDEVSVSMTINGPAQALFAFLLVAAEEQGVAPAQRPPAPC